MYNNNILPSFYNFNIPKPVPIIKGNFFIHI